MALVGTYNMNFSVNEVWIAVVMGVIGFLMGKLQMPKTPMIITMSPAPERHCFVSGSAKLLGRDALGGWAAGIQTL